MSNISVNGELNINNSNIKYTDENTFRELSDYQLKKNDLVMCMTDVSKEFGVVGKTAIIDKDDTYVLNQRVGRIRPNKELDVNFLYYYTNSKYFLNDIYQKVTGSAQYNLSTADIKQSKILLPPLPEQQKIAEILSCIDKDIEKTDQIIKETEKLKKGLVQKLLTKGIGHKKFKKTKLGEIPGSWNFVKLNSVCSKITDGTHKTPKYINEGVPFLRVTDIQEEKIDWDNVKYISQEEHKELIRRCRPEIGDILLSKNGTVGITKIVNWDKEFSIFVSLCLIKPKINLIDLEFLNLILNSDLVMNQIKMRSKQGSVTNLHLEEIRDFTIPLPKKDEQNKITGIILSVNNKISINKQIKNKLTELKRGLMQDLLSGKVRV